MDRNHIVIPSLKLLALLEKNPGMRVVNTSKFGTVPPNPQAVDFIQLQYTDEAGATHPLHSIDFSDIEGIVSNIPKQKNAGGKEAEASIAFAISKNAKAYRLIQLLSNAFTADI